MEAITEKTSATLRCQFCLTWNRIDVSRAADRPKCGKCAKPMLLDRPIAPITTPAIPEAPPGAPIGDPGMDWLAPVGWCAWKDRL